MRHSLFLLFSFFYFFFSFSLFATNYTDNQILNSVYNEGALSIDVGLSTSTISLQINPEALTTAPTEYVLLIDSYTVSSVTISTSTLKAEFQILTDGEIRFKGANNIDVGSTGRLLDGPATSYSEDRYKGTVYFQCPAGVEEQELQVIKYDK